MPKYDAFGREIGEDSLEGLGSSSAEPAQTAATRTTPPVIVRRQSAGRGCLIATIVLVSILGLLVAAAVVGLNSVHVSGDTATVTPSGPVPKGLGDGSLVRAGALAAALQRVKTQGGGRLTNLRVAPERIDAQLLTPAGRLRNVQVKPGGELSRLGADSGAGFDTVPTIPFGRLNPAAPQRLALAGAERVRQPVSQLQYAVPSRIAGKLTWAAHFAHGRYVIGDRAGHFQRALP